MRVGCGDRERQHDRHGHARDQDAVQPKQEREAEELHQLSKDRRSSRPGQCAKGSGRRLRTSEASPCQRALHKGVNERCLLGQAAHDEQRSLRDKRARHERQSGDSDGVDEAASDEDELSAPGPVRKCTKCGRRQNARQAIDAAEQAALVRVEAVGLEPQEDVWVVGSHR